jgi:hypothetical protein
MAPLGRAQGSGFVWQVLPSEALADRYASYIRALQLGILGIVQRRAPEIQSWMRDNAPWTDQTGNARQALHTEIVALTSQIALELAHGVTYGVHLELRNSGRYAIIGPALDEWAPVIWQDVKEMLGR